MDTALLIFVLIAFYLSGIIVDHSEKISSRVKLSLACVLFVSMLLHATIGPKYVGVSVISAVFLSGFLTRRAGILRILGRK